MNASSPRTADVRQIQTFVDALFRYAEKGSFVSLRAFPDNKNGPPFCVVSHRIGSDLQALVNEAARLATACAVSTEPVVFCPPIATFTNGTKATETDLACGLALSVECDASPGAARQRLESLLGPATVVVASGGEWTDLETGEVEEKLHLHWRLTEPTTTAAEHMALKQARAFATRFVGGDWTNIPTVHPIRWPGSWHRKSLPRLSRIGALHDAQELNLGEALQRLQDAYQAAGDDPGPTPPGETPGAAGTDPRDEERETAELVRAVLAAEDYHASLTALAMRFLLGGLPDAQTVLILRGIMLAVPEAARDLKDGTQQPGRWQARYDDIPRAVSTARAKLDKSAKKTGGLDSIDLASFRLDVLTAGEPPPQRFLLAPLMPLGVVGLLFGPGGVGKSFVALELCLAVAGRGSLGGSVNFATGPLGSIVPSYAAGATVFLTLEDSTAELHRRAATLDPEGKRTALPCYVIPAIELPDFDPALVRQEGRTVALTALALNGLDTLLSNVARGAGVPVRLLVLDPAGDFIDADENSAEAVKPLMRCLRAIAGRHGCTILLLGHVSKGMDGDAPSMRGSGAWVANSRFAFALYRPVKEEAANYARKVGCPLEAVVCGNLVKANHAGAPIGIRRWFRRDGETGRLIDIAPRARDDATAERELLEGLVIACREYAAAGLPYTVTGAAGLYTGRADLPARFSDLSRRRLEDLGDAALTAGLLVKARNMHTQGATKYLDVPHGPLARGVKVKLFQGSRAEALARYREQQATPGREDTAEAA